LTTVYKNKNSSARLAFEAVSKDLSSQTPLPCDLDIWRNRSKGRPARDKTGPAPRSGLGASQARLELFEEIVLPHLDAAYNLARWLTHNPADAQDVVQESCLRAVRFFDGYKGGDPKAWLLAIVRNTCRTWQRRQKYATEAVPFDEAAHSHTEPTRNQEQSMADGEQMRLLLKSIESLPVDFREVLILRELEEFSYQEIADVTGLPLGTVMSRLSRARKRLEELVANQSTEAPR
jgi:RNA polymerase sigma-70 factor (ECF subfamily)